MQTHGVTLQDTFSRGLEQQGLHTPGRPLAERRDDAVAGLCGAWMIAGLFLDGWAHRNQKPETFFSPWHGILYSGFFASAVWMLYVVRRHQQPGQPFLRSMPVGYEFRTAGVAVFGTGAIFDFIWHTVFGIEVNIEALLSPSHLVLLSGGLLMAVGPILSTLAREPVQKPTWSSMGAIVGTVGFITALMQFFLMYLSPYDEGTYTRRSLNFAMSDGGDWMREMLIEHGIASIFVFTFVMVVAILWILRNIEVPPGAFLVVWFLPTVLQTLLTSFHTFPRVLGSFAAAMLGEFVWPRVRSRVSGVTGAAIQAALLSAMTFITWLGLFAPMLLSRTLGWQVEFWLGVPFFAGLLCALTVLGTSSRRCRVSS